jgi:hypothetical protein
MVQDNDSKRQGIIVCYQYFATYPGQAIDKMQVTSMRKSSVLNILRAKY